MRRLNNLKISTLTCLIVSGCTHPAYDELQTMRNVAPPIGSVMDSTKLTGYQQLSCARQKIGLIDLEKYLPGDRNIKIFISQNWPDIVNSGRRTVPGMPQILHALRIITSNNSRIQVFTALYEPDKNADYDFHIQGFLSGVDEDVGEASSGFGIASRKLRASIGSHYSDTLINYTVVVKNHRTNKILWSSSPVRILRLKDHGVDSKANNRSNRAINLDFASGTAHSKTLFTQSMMNSAAIETIANPSLLNTNLSCES
jgi:hypothetical protein